MRHRAISLALIGLLLSACAEVLPAPRPADPPDEAAARAFLAQAVTLSRAGDFAALCAVGGGNCEQILADVGRDVPATDPVVVGQRVEQPQRQGDGWSAGGRILELCGRRNDGTLYYSEMIVFSDRSRLIAIEPVFWWGFHVGGAHVTAAGPQDPAAECAGKGFKTDA